jgi:hypothetical protein
MGRGIKLTETLWDELDRLRFTTPSAKVFRNCLIILKSDLSETIASIADEIGCGTDTVILPLQGSRSRLPMAPEPGRRTRSRTAAPTVRPPRRRSRRS